MGKGQGRRAWNSDRNPHWKNISKSRTGKKHTEEAKKNMSRDRTGRKLSEEHKKNISIAKTGSNHPMYGKKHTEAKKSKSSNPMERNTQKPRRVRPAPVPWQEALS